MTATDVRHAKVEVAIGFEQRADAATAAVLRSLLDVVGSNLEGAIAGEDVEYLHQLRIAVRRSRTVQRQFKGAFPALDLIPANMRGSFTGFINFGGQIGGFFAPIVVGAIVTATKSFSGGFSFMIAALMISAASLLWVEVTINRRTQRSLRDEPSLHPA